MTNLMIFSLVLLSTPFMVFLFSVVYGVMRGEELNEHFNDCLVNCGVIFAGLGCLILVADFITYRFS